MPAAVRTDPLQSDRFVVGDRLGAGGMGEVFRAHDRDIGHEIALKLLRDPRQVYRFKREFRALADVIHPNLVRLYELVSSGEQWFFTMELVDGVDFLQWVRHGHAPPAGSEPEIDQPTAALDPPTAALDDPTCTIAGLAVVANLDPAAITGASAPWPSVTEIVEPSRRVATDQIATARGRNAPGTRPRGTAPLSQPEQWQRLRDGLRQLALGIQALHDHGTLHRDIKPSNVRVDRDGRVVLLDFGIITELSRPTADDSPGHAWGTPAYMAPEIGSPRGLGPAIDWYAVGIMVYEAIAGRRPFHGMPREILEAKQVCDALPVDELAPTVPPDLARLCMDLLSRNPDRRPLGRDVLARVGASARGRAVRHGDLLIGRGAQLATLRAAHAAVVAGQSRIAVVSGPSGVGKSTLINRFLSEAARDGAMVVSGRCYERESVPFKAVDDLIDNLCQSLAALPSGEVRTLLPRSVGALASLFPLLLQIEAVREAAAGAVEVSDRHEHRRTAFIALRELLVRLCDRKRLVLYIDDAQWGDDDSAALLMEVFRSVFAPAALLVIGCRHDIAGPFVSQLRNSECTRDEIAVTDLSPADTLEAARALLGRAAAPAHLAETIARESGGNPFIITELVRHVVDASHDLRTTEGGITLADIVRERLAAMATPARRLLALLAVAAWPVPRTLALGAAGIIADDGDVVGDLLEAHLINVRTSRDGEALVTFHDRVRTEVTAQLGEGEIVNVHRRLADVLKDNDTHLVEHLAQHLELAGELTRAGNCYVRAADTAAKKLAFERAGRLYTRAIELLDPDGKARGELNLRMAEAFQNAGKGAESAAAYQAAAEHVDPALALRLRGLASQQLLRAGNIDEGLAVVQRVLTEVGMRLPETKTRVILAILRQRAALRLRGLEFVERPAAEVSLAELTTLDACFTASATLGMCDTTAGALFQVHHLLAALRVGEPQHVAHALSIEAVYRALPGPKDVSDVDAISMRARDMADSSGDPMTITWAYGADAVTRYQLAQWRRSCHSAQIAVAATRGRAGIWFERATIEMYRLWSLFWLGGFRELTERSTAFLAEAQAIGDLYSATCLSVGRPALQWLIRDRAEEARRVADDAMSRWSHRGYHLQHLWYALAVANTDMYRGRGWAAWTRLRDEWKPVRASMLFRIKMVRIECAWARGRAALAAAVEDPSKPEPLRDARAMAKQLRGEKRPEAIAMALCLEAGIANVTRKEGSAVRLLTAAADHATGMEMAFIAAAAEAARGRLLGGDHGAGLTREAEARMTDETVVDPAALSRVFLPGFER